MAIDTSNQLLEHLHVLSQEALDHADLTVLTGTLGAAALIKNTLWCYNEQVDVKGSSSLHAGYKQYQEMSEALAERLLDLHCRLLSLYVMQDADSLSWDHPHPFFEGERGSFVVQMWWLYMQGTRQDLWNSVPPKTAQRVLAGMLNESLTILASRYNQAEPSPARSLLLITDISNVLMCVNELLPSICNDASELLGLNGGSKILRDIHSKCHQLLICFVLRGCPLSTLFKVFRLGLENVVAFEDRCESFAPWMFLVAPELVGSTADCISDLSDGHAIMLELKVLAAQPQPSYPLLLNILTMRDFKVATLLLQKMIPLLEKEEVKSSIVGAAGNIKCNGFLCSGGGDCKNIDDSAYDAVHALTVVMINVCSVEDISRLFLPAIEKSGPSWASCLDRHQVWNLNRPPWLAAILAYLEPPLIPLVHTIIRAANAGETVEQTIALTLAGLLKMADVLPPQIFKVAFVLQEDIPADVKPLGKSVLMQMLISVVYELLTKSKEDSATALAEALCHLRVPPNVIDQLEDSAEEYIEDTELALVSDITVSRILFTQVGRRALKSAYHCVIQNQEWLLSMLIPGYVPSTSSNSLLHKMFHIGKKPFDQVLSGEWKPDYLSILERPLSLSRETAWLNLSKRPDFMGHSSTVSKHDRAVVENISSMFLNAE
ncbi:UNVERIFIED_CONTAM: hypothetical protein PYX00_000321 [Menopon gallinae]